MSWKLHGTPRYQYGELISTGDSDLELQESRKTAEDFIRYLKTK